MQKSKKKLSAILLIVIAIVALTVTLVEFNFSEKSSANYQITELVAKYNKNCPLTIQEGIRLDSVSLPKEKVVRYNLTLVNVEKKTAEIETIKENIEQSLISTAKANPGLKIFRDHKFTLVYSYSDKNKIYLFEIMIAPNQYK